ncbi:MAG: DUF134 domain-containing protein [Clostridiales bacterium]|nr:DUF134 domain-containing protein [Clostridiales bacterium]
MIVIPRPRKRRNIGFNPEFIEFGPMGQKYHEDVIILKIEEVESLRLMDLENYDQQACADEMNIGRTTLQRIYKDARKKVADSLINGKRLVIENQEPIMPMGNGHQRRHGKW